MPYTIQQLKDELGSIFHGTSLNNVQQLDALIYRAARDLVLDVDLYETKRYTTIGPVYNGVYDYAGITDLKGNAISDIYPMVNRVPQDWFNQLYNQEFDRNKAFTLQPGFSIKTDTNVKTIRLNYPTINTGIVLNNTDSLAGNGTWVGNENIEDLKVNNTNAANGSACLEYSILAAEYPGGLLSNGDMSLVDLSTHLDQSTLFMDVYVPINPNGGIYYTLSWGSSVNDYWTVSGYVYAGDEVLKKGWNTIAFDWRDATHTGSPDASKINYVQVVTSVNQNTGWSGLLIDGITSQLGVTLGLSYFSKYLFQDANTLLPQETVTDDSNLVMLDTDSINLLLFLCADYAAQQIQGVEALFYDAPYFQKKYAEAKRKYEARYKSDLQKPTTQYYNLQNNSYRRFFGRRSW